MNNCLKKVWQVIKKIGIYIGWAIALLVMVDPWETPSKQQEKKEES